MSSCYRAMAVTTPTWKLSYFPERDEGDTVVAMVIAPAMVMTVAMVGWLETLGGGDAYDVDGDVEVVHCLCD